MDIPQAQGSRSQAAASTPEQISTRGRWGTRWRMLGLIVLAMFVNYMDRGNLGVAAPLMQQALHLHVRGLGILFSAFSWSYLICIPLAGILLDRVGPRLMLAVGLIGWSAFTLLTGTVNSFAGAVACRMGVGVFESPAIPTNIRCVSDWFPERERGLAIGWFAATQSLALGVMAPTLTWILVIAGWRPVFYVTGIVGILAAAVWYCCYRDPSQSSAVSPEELALIRGGGGLVESGTEAARRPFTWKRLRQLFRERQLIGMFMGQYAVMTTLYFFVTWFPSYLIKAKGLTIPQSGEYAVLPFLMAVVGALAGGKWSDAMLATGKSRSVARKAPIIIGFALASVMVSANYLSDVRLVVGLLGLAFFGQAMASTVSNALLIDIAPKDSIGLTGGLLTFFANLGSASSPLIVGLLVERFGGFEPALAYVSVVSVMGAAAYLLVVGPVKRIVPAAG